MYVCIILCVLVHCAIGFEERIIGGSDALISKHPYQAALYSSTGRPFNKGYFCGAAILSSRFLLTTAFCGLGKTEVYTVVVGESFIPKYYDAEWLNKRAYKIKNIIRHPEFDIWGTSNFINDIAVLEINGRLKLDGKFVKPIRIAKKSAPIGTMAVVSGFGSKDAWVGDIDNNVFVHLRAASVPVLDHSSCQKHFSEVLSLQFLKEDNICAGLEKDVGSCLNDYGGPLAVANELIGLVAHGTNCFGGIGLYTDVQKHRDFIRNATAGSI